MASESQQINFAQALRPLPLQAADPRASLWWQSGEERGWRGLGFGFGVPPVPGGAEQLLGGCCLLQPIQDGKGKGLEQGSSSGTMGSMPVPALQASWI